jgi:hypothetical protein
MSKQLVRPKGEFQLIDHVTGAWIRHDRPTVVQPSTFTQERLALDLEVLEGDLPAEATDEDWAGFWASAEGNLALALASFKSQFAAPELPLVTRKSKKFD